MNARKRWTREELLVALNIYHKLTFGQFHARQPVIIAVAGKIGRTADNVPMEKGKLGAPAPALELRRHSIRH